MKTITKQRLLKALENSSRYYSAKPEHHIVTTMAQIGLRTACASAFGQETEITDKERLELAYQGFNDPEQIFKRLSHWSASRSLDSALALKEAWMSSWHRALEQKWARDEKIYVVQRKHSISGLDEAEVDYGNQVIKYHKPSWELELLDSDYEVMKGERTMLAKAFLDACYHHQMKLYQRISTSDSDGWYEANSVRVKTHADLFDWAKVWNHEYYVNRKQMQDQGFTEKRR